MNENETTMLHNMRSKYFNRQEISMYRSQHTRLFQIVSQRQTTFWHVRTELGMKVNHQTSDWPSGAASGLSCQQTFCHSGHRRSFAVLCCELSWSGAEGPWSTWWYRSSNDNCAALAVWLCLGVVQSGCCHHDRWPSGDRSLASRRTPCHRACRQTSLASGASFRHDALCQKDTWSDMSTGGNGTRWTLCSWQCAHLQMMAIFYT